MLALPVMQVGVLAEHARKPSVRKETFRNHKSGVRDDGNVTVSENAVLGTESEGLHTEHHNEVSKAGCIYLC
jgi:hypothetical protein